MLSPALASTTKLFYPSARVKSIDWHSMLPWVALGLYSGDVVILDTTSPRDGSPSVVHTIHVSKQPVRAVRFIPQKNWIVVGSDDLFLRVYDLTDWALVIAIEAAHGDYIRCLDIHPSLPLVLSCGDDALVKTWNWDLHWANIDTFTGHSKYVMMAKFSPQGDTIVSVSMDCTIRMWKLGAPLAPVFVIEHAHANGIDCVGFDATGSQLVTGADDFTLKLWDVNTQRLMKTLPGHSGNVTSAAFLPLAPSIVVSTSEDKSVRAWNISTGAIVWSLVDAGDLGRAWGVSCKASHVAIGFDQGCCLVDIHA
ncbi:hypothetical protein H310_09831 [Aphanomyces invadans]|uniref:Uncharacterized protein n=1 Tax=Aphanomyces invadans TaxID=157072 RepID=A0A024TSI9_9STRA|nr:hypothetical protein H310_09831 [Aphanomyces invadans]ETV96983.1 hypothetical protein H310_09831 [Aphanomyces invadans]|eukprot:XP_008874229.1 hypothetical protein H310_09831 [Aphanomyces invadans]